MAWQLTINHTNYAPNTMASLTLNRYLTDDDNGQLTLVTQQALQHRTLIKQNCRLSWQNKPIFNGLITAIQHTQANNQHRTQLTLHSYLYLLKQQSHQRRFVRKSLAAILDILFKPYPIKLTLNDDIPTIPLALITQYDQSDYGFFQSLLHQHGCWHILHGQQLRITTQFEQHLATTLTYPHTLVNVQQQIKPVSSQLTLKDYNEASPAYALIAHDNHDNLAIGRQYQYGHHTNSPKALQTLLQNNRHQQYAQQNRVTAQTDLQHLSLGERICINGHPSPSINQHYHITALQYQLQQQSGLAFQPNNPQQAAMTLTLTPSHQTCPRSTTQPSLASLQRAEIYSDTPNKPLLDAQGRYLVRMLYEEKAQPYFIRKMQALVGKQFGLHFPLHHGTDVLLAHINGDINRPVILGSLAKKDNNPVTNHNPRQNIIRTKNQHELLMDDKAGAITLSTTKKLQALQLNQQQCQLMTQKHDINLTCHNNHTHYCQGNMTQQSDDKLSSEIKQAYRVKTKHGDIILNSKQANFYHRCQQTLTLTSQHQQHSSTANTHWQSAHDITLHSQQSFTQTLLQGKLHLSGKKITCHAIKQLQLTCGNSQISVHENGDIFIKSTTIELNCKHNFTLPRNHIKINEKS